MLVKLKTAYAYRGETLNAGEIIAVDNVFADSLFLNGYAVPAYADDEDYEYEHNSLPGQELGGTDYVAPLQGQEFSEGEGIEHPESVSESEKHPENTDEGEETPPQETQTEVTQQSEKQEAETVPLGRSGKAGKK